MKKSRALPNMLLALLLATCLSYAAASAAEGEKVFGRSAETQKETTMPQTSGNQAEQASAASEDAKTNTPEQAEYPGVQNILYRSGSDNEPHAIIWYPSFGNEKVDSDLKYFVAVQGADFSKDVEDAFPDGAEKPASYDDWEMSGFYTLSRPAKDIVSVTFKIYSYTGGAHGNYFIRCLNYNLDTGAPLQLKDIFGDTEKALKIMSDYCYEKLRSELEQDAVEDMLHGGTAPEESNFMNLSLTQDGVVVEFQPYQVGPWAIGQRNVAIPLSELADARPSAAIWPNLAEKPETAPGEAKKADTKKD